MRNIKHIGRLKSNKRRLVVAYRTLPDEPYNCLVIFADTLPPDEHDLLMNIVESAVGQQADELAEVMARSRLPDGLNMLAKFHNNRKLQKVSTADVEMVPNINSSVSLDELNQLIANARGVSLEDLAVKDPSSARTSQTDKRSVISDTDVQSADAEDVQQPLSDSDLAKKYRADAARLSQEAAQLRRMADELAPRKKPTPKKKTENNV